MPGFGKGSLLLHDGRPSGLDCSCDVRPDDAAVGELSPASELSSGRDCSIAMLRDPSQLVWATFGRIVNHQKRGKEIERSKMRLARSHMVMTLCQTFPKCVPRPGVEYPTTSLATASV